MRKKIKYRKSRLRVQTGVGGAGAGAVLVVVVVRREDLGRGGAIWAGMVGGFKEGWVRWVGIDEFVYDLD